jgi:isoleucyl-tRNA synthetase
VKQVNYLDDAAGVLSKKVKPNFKTLGPKFGKDMKAVAELISSMSADTLANLETAGEIQLEGFGISLGDVEILTEDMPGYVTASEGGLTIALDQTLSPELIREGMSREFVNRIQNVRKDSGFDVVDKVHIVIQEDSALWKESIDEFSGYIAQEVQALSIQWVAKINGPSTEINLEEVNLRVQVTVG